MFYGSNIVTLQCLFYLTLGLWNCALSGAQSKFSSRRTHPCMVGLTKVKSQGWSLVLANLLNAPVGSVYLMWIVERAKKCLDFTATCYFIHLLSCCFYAGFPLSWEWWLVNIIGLVVMALFGEWLCVKREMQEIPLSQIVTRAK